MKHIVFRLFCVLLLGLSAVMSQAQEYVMKLHLTTGEVVSYKVNDVQEVSFSEEDDGLYHSDPAVADEGYYVINRAWDQHAQLVMENCIENSNQKNEFTQSKPNFTPLFRVYYDCGYDFTVEIKGKRTGKVYDYEWIVRDSPRNSVGLASWGFYMPEEEVTITVRSHEKKTYEGQPFAGNYHAAQFSVGEKWTTRGGGNSSMFVMGANQYFNLVRNTSNTNPAAGDTICGEYTMKRDAAVEGRSSFEYLVDEIDYLHRDLTFGWGVQGYYYDSGDLLAVTVELDDNGPDNHFIYYGSQLPFEYTCVAANSFGSRYILEVQKAGQKRQWFYFYPETYQFSEMTTEDITDHDEGIATCDAIFSIDAVPFVRLSRDEDGMPVFKYKSNEEGTYVCAGLDDLVLDGFGRGQWGALKGEYVLDGVKVNFNSGDVQEVFIIDTTAKTYKLEKDAGNEKLPEDWSASVTEADNAAYWDGAATKATLVIQLDHDYSGKVKEGYAALRWNIYNKSFFRDESLVAATVPYLYDAGAKTLTFKDVLQGEGYSSVKKDIVFIVDDGALAGTQTVYLTGSPTRYVDLTKVTFKNQK